ncbi:uncharacterized protein K452DRAFT_294794 [Aplosporella prunicola CBS 121167]|uniref:N-glycosylation protein EOS1 n=1 Tax=Aplosporella prunicola CBS 121167 TaxID=1176127 RepID=A0A6A6BQ36_9PEZI|nr:uncharacterized protein K452DRAFT_294794 [Aplosporella prunicola CBS 121167]KAF2146206.1 hypothetical protein K452DRAFT_294794 [Aplosporella prunicola CBS 121167]
MTSQHKKNSRPQPPQGQHPLPPTPPQFARPALNGIAASAPALPLSLSHFPPPSSPPPCYAEVAAAEDCAPPPPPSSPPAAAASPALLGRRRHQHQHPQQHQQQRQYPRHQQRQRQRSLPSNSLPPDGVFALSATGTSRSRSTSVSIAAAAAATAERRANHPMMQQMQAQTQSQSQLQAQQQQEKKEADAERPEARGALHPQVAVLLGVKERWHVPLLLCRALATGPPCTASGYLSFYFADCLMSRWLLNYTPSATLVRLFTLSITNVYTTSWWLHLSGATRDARLLLPAWICIASTLTFLYHLAHRHVNIRRETRAAVRAFWVSSTASLFALLLQLHVARGTWRGVPLVGILRGLFWRGLVLGGWGGDGGGGGGEGGGEGGV